MYMRENNNNMRITHIKNNWRYRILRYNNKIYLLDTSTFWFSVILFVINPLLPMDGYEVDDKTVRKLNEKYKKELNINFSMIILISSLSTIVGILIKRLFIMNDLVGSYSFLFVYLLPVVFILYFTISRYFKEKRLVKIIGQKGKKKRIRFCNKPEKKKDTDKWEVYSHSVVVWLLVFCLGTFLGRRIIVDDFEVLNYFWYFVVVFSWTFGSMYVDIGKKYLENMTVVIEDKERK